MPYKTVKRAKLQSESTQSASWTHLATGTKLEIGSL